MAQGPDSSEAPCGGATPSLAEVTEKLGSRVQDSPSVNYATVAIDFNLPGTKEH